MKRIVTMITSFIFTILLVLSIMPTDIVKAEDAQDEIEYTVTIYYVNKEGKVATKTRTAKATSCYDFQHILPTWDEPIEDAYEGTTVKYSWLPDRSNVDGLPIVLAMYGDWTVDEKYVVGVSACPDTHIDGYNKYIDNSYYKVYAFANGDPIVLPETGSNGNKILWKPTVYCMGLILDPKTEQLVVPSDFADYVRNNSGFTYDELDWGSLNTILVQGYEIVPTETETPTPSEPSKEPETPSEPSTPAGSNNHPTDSIVTPAAPSNSNNSSSNTDVPAQLTTTVVSDTETVERTTDGNEIRTIKNPSFTNITVSGDSSVISTGTKLDWEYAPKDSAKFILAADAIRNSTVVKSTTFSVVDFGLTDINGTPIHQLDGYVEVTIPMQQACNHALAAGRTITVYRLEENGTLTKCDTSVVTNPDGTQNIVFKTNHFSTYIFAEEMIEVTSPKTNDIPAGVLMLVAITLICAGGILFTKRCRY